MEKKGIAIKYGHFELAEAFKHAAEKIGWIYNSLFNVFEEEPGTSCLFFCDSFSAFPGICSFSLSNAGSDITAYRLPEQWNEALAAITKYMVEVKEPPKRFSILEPIPHLTRLEYAAITIASGMVHGVWQDGLTLQQMELIKESAISLGRAILQECNQ